MILTRYYGVPDHAVGRYLLPFAAGNFLGPALLGRLFDRLGRKPMIVGTYAASGLLLAGTGLLFQRGLLGATGQTVCWCVTFFFASAAASSAYLTVSELFPVELRGMAIAHFYALATALGGPVATTVFGRIVEGGSRSALLAGYLVAGGLMVAAAAIAWRLAVPAEGRSLEELSGDQAAPA
jgi:MFS family permease